MQNKGLIAASLGEAFFVVAFFKEFVAKPRRFG